MVRAASTRLLVMVLLLWGLAIPVASLFATDTIRTVSLRSATVNDFPVFAAGRAAWEVAAERIGLRSDASYAAARTDDGTGLDDAGEAVNGG